MSLPDFNFLPRDRAQHAYNTMQDLTGGIGGLIDLYQKHGILRGSIMTPLAFDTVISLPDVGLTSADQWWFTMYVAGISREDLLEACPDKRTPMEAAPDFWRHYRMPMIDDGVNRRRLFPVMGVIYSKAEWDYMKRCLNAMYWVQLGLGARLI
ncbi:hypothetical protein [Delftia phage PhiW-14]|uniref:Uncharacterized protein n=1 Tax=Delftia phage PhiW-14 TaxID=665032 RepID=C9DGF9_BPW14|nr:hypothetical protein DP-phiW-14_gp189 [Delftia phage PhiW-14]ACV50210.1 hypothetical protein [Delftia phage PhiW-14]